MAPRKRGTFPNYIRMFFAPLNTILFFQRWRAKQDSIQNPSTRFILSSSKGSGQRLLSQLKDWLRTEDPHILAVLMNEYNL